MKLRSLLLFGSMAVLGAAFTSCTKDVDLFDNDANMAKLKSQYEENFVKKYGPIDPNQTWDFASMDPVTSLPSIGGAGTRTEGITVTQSAPSTMKVEKDVISWMKTNMKAGDNNTKKGSPFFMVTQKNSFTIVPFYQGQASYFWELWVNIGGEEFKIWTKNQDLKYKAADGSWKTPDNNGIPADALEIEAPTYTFTATENVNMYFFLRVWTGGESAWKKDKEGKNAKKLTSLDQRMISLKGIDKPQNVPEGNDVTIIGCEDNPNANAGDKDFEDLVFMMYGKPAPPVNHVDEVEVRETKRYMIEDLGSTDDFDFNDIVVDVSIVYKNQIKYKFDEYGAMVFESETEIPGTRHQDAIIRAAGGTLDFTLEIGSTKWSKSSKFTTTDMLNTGVDGTPIYYTGSQSVLAQFDIANNDWNPATNNITITVEGKGKNDGVKTIKFPKEGEAPMIIAVEPTATWMKERVGVPRDWWY